MANILEHTISEHVQSIEKDIAQPRYFCCCHLLHSETDEHIDALDCFAIPSGVFKCELDEQFIISNCRQYLKDLAEFRA
jgi:hypothetical protein